MSMTDQQIISLFRKYESQTIQTFKEVAEEDDVTIHDLNEEGIFDEFMCLMSDRDSCLNVLDSIRNSIGVEEYGMSESQE